MDRDYFLSERPRLGPLAVDECYAFVSPKAMGGSGEPETLQLAQLKG